MCAIDGELFDDGGLLCDNDSFRGGAKKAGETSVFVEGPEGAALLLSRKASESGVLSGWTRRILVKGNRERRRVDSP